jgi:hypothetical protein
VTASARIDNSSSVKKVTVRGWDPKTKQAAIDNTQNEYTVSIDANIRESHRQGNVSQLVMVVDGSDEDPIALDDQKIKTKSNIKNDRLMNNGSNQSGIGEPNALDEQKIKTKSNIKNDRLMSPDDEMKSDTEEYSKILNQSIADIDGDGISEMLIGGALPGGAILSSAVMRPGNPIGGIIVKGGKNPGGNLRTVQTMAP